MRKFSVAVLTGLMLVSCSGEPVREVGQEKHYGTFASSEGASNDISPANAKDAPTPASKDTFDPKEVSKAANDFFGGSSEGLAKALERAFKDFGQPNAYITGEEAGGAVVVGFRYGKGVLTYKGGDSQTVYWQSPSIGWDFGGNASKVFTLVYNLRNSSELFQRFPAVDGSLYLVAGMGMNYQRSGDITLAPIRTGVGLRAGASVGYVHYTRNSSAIPF
jgi:hypothetical protein